MMRKKAYIGKNLRKLLEDLGISQAELADCMDTTQTVISRYCTDQTVPTATAIIQICNVLEVSADYLLFGKDFEKRRGEWIEHKNTCVCSECRTPVKNDGISRYCPNCGSRMKR